MSGAKKPGPSSVDYDGGYNGVLDYVRDHAKLDATEPKREPMRVHIVPTPDVIFEGARKALEDETATIVERGEDDS